MSDIMDRLRQMADLFEAQQAPHNMVLHLRAAADEIERLRAALRFYAEGEWSDGYPGGVKIDDNTLDFGDIARAALDGK